MDSRRGCRGRSSADPRCSFRLIDITPSIRRMKHYDEKKDTIKTMLGRSLDEILDHVNCIQIAPTVPD